MRLRWTPGFLPVLLAAALLTTGCSAVRKVKTGFGASTQIEVEIGDALNQNSALRVDLVVVHDKKLEDPLKEFSARQWFEKRDQFRRENPRGYQICSWEWVPGVVNRIPAKDEGKGSDRCAWQWIPADAAPKPTLALEIKSGARTGVVYADYLSPGPHRAVVDPRQHLKLELGRNGFKIEPVE